MSFIKLFDSTMLRYIILDNVIKLLCLLLVILIPTLRLLLLVFPILPLLTLLQRNEIDGSVFNLAHFDTYIKLDTI